MLRLTVRRVLRSRLLLLLGLIYGAFLVVLQQTFRGSLQSLPPLSPRDQRPEDGRKHDLGIKPIDRIVQHSSGFRSQNNNDMTFHNANTTARILRSVEANSVLIRRLKEARQQLAARVKAASIRPLPVRPVALFDLVTKVPFLELTDGFYIVAGFLDDRLQKLQNVRILALCSSVDCEQNWQITCHFHASQDLDQNPNHHINGKIFITGIEQESVPVMARKYAMCENHGKKYGGWIFTCPVPPSADKLLTSVSLSLTDAYGKTSKNRPRLPLQRITGRWQRQRNADDNSFNAATQLEDASSRGNNEGLVKTSSERHLEKNTHRAERPWLNEKAKAKADRDKLPEHNDTIGVCVPPIYGDVDLTRIVNFVEMTRILGATQVFLYVNDISDDMRQLLQEYALLDTRYLRLVGWTPPVIDANVRARDASPAGRSWLDSTPLPISEVIWNRGQLLAIQHCLYTNMDAFDWLLFMDIDEMLFPAENTAFTWQELFHKTLWPSSDHTGSSAGDAIGVKANSKYPPNVAGLVFESATFYADHESQALYDISYFQRLSRRRQTDASRSKLAVRPQMVFEMGIHHLSRALTDKSQTIHVPPNRALVRHYREMDWWTEQEAAYSYFVEETDLISDTSTLKYQAMLSEASQSVLNYLGKTMMLRHKSRLGI